VNLKWIRHPETGGVVQVPESAVPIYRQSNWDVLTDEQVADLEKSFTEQAATAEKAMADAAVFEPPTTSEPVAPEPATTPAPRSSKSVSKENS